MQHVRHATGTRPGMQHLRHGAAARVAQVPAGDPAVALAQQHARELAMDLLLAGALEQPLQRRRLVIGRERARAGQVAHAPGDCVGRGLAGQKPVGALPEPEQSGPEREQRVARAPGGRERAHEGGSAHALADQAAEVLRRAQQAEPVQVVELRRLDAAGAPQAFAGVVRAVGEGQVLRAGQGTARERERRIGVAGLLVDHQLRRDRDADRLAGEQHAPRHQAEKADRAVAFLVDERRQLFVAPGRAEEDQLEIVA